MHAALQLRCFGKQVNREVTMGAVADTCSSHHLLYVTDIVTKMTFLVDSGASLSVLPVGRGAKTEDEGCLFAANGSSIKTYGEKLLSLDLGLRREYTWKFIIADVRYPILGADFLKNFSKIFGRAIMLR